MLGKPKYASESRDACESRHLGFSDSVGRIVVKLVNSPSEHEAEARDGDFFLDI